MLLRRLILVLIFFLAGNSFITAVPQYAFRVSFTDKSGSPPLSNPLAFLSQRSLDRRTAQGILVTDEDRPVSPLYIDTALQLTSGKLHVTSRWHNTCVLLLQDSSLILQLLTKPYVSGVKLVGYFPGGLHKPGPEDDHSKFASERTGPVLKTTSDPVYYGASWNQTTLVHGDCLHDAGFDGAGKLIAVLDDGFLFVDTSPAFDSLYNSGRILDHYNFVKADTPVYVVNSHGTQVLSTMAAYIPDTYVGSAVGAQYALYVTEDQGSEQPVEMDNMIAAIERADSVGADIVSSSLGYDVFTGPAAYTITPADRDGKTTAVAIAVNMAARKGILPVISAGNEGSGGILTPGDADSALTIGSVDINKIPVSNSGHGPNAAGVVKPDVCVLGGPASVMSANANPFNVSGTSMATPQVGGFAACLWQSSPGRTASEIRRAIQMTADHFSAPSLPQLGYGVPEFCSALHILGVPEVKQRLPFRLYPNPAKDQIGIYIRSEKKQVLQIDVYDASGRIVLHDERPITGGDNSLQLVLPGSIAPGLYCCRLSALGEVHSQMFLVD